MSCQCPALGIDILRFLTRRSQNQNGHNILKLETDEEPTQRPMNRGNGGQVEDFSTQDLQNSDG
jgi:hypothetical protein